MSKEIKVGHEDLEGRAELEARRSGRGEERAHLGDRVRVRVRPRVLILDLDLLDLAGRG